MIIVFDAFQALLPTAVAGDYADSSVPRGYLNIIIFSTDYSASHHAMKPISADGYQEMELVERELIAAYDGVAYIYVANESGATTADIYFDELAITHAKSTKSLQVTQSSDYYPFGMKMHPMSYQKEGHDENKFLYQGQEHHDELGWYDFELRDNDATIGRWLTVDPLRQYASPYLSMGNNPINRIDPDGGEDINGDGIDDGILLGGVTVTASAPTTFETAAYLSSLPFSQRMEMLGFQQGGRFNQMFITPDVQYGLNTVGVGFGVDFFIGPGGGFSIDRILDDEGGNDLYFTLKGGVGVDITADYHGTIFEGNFGPKEIAGKSYFYGAGYGPVGFERAGSIQYDDVVGLAFNRLVANSVSIGVGTQYLVGSGKIGFGYTFNLSDYARYFQGQTLRSYDN